LAVRSRLPTCRYLLQEPFDRVHPFPLPTHTATDGKAWYYANNVVLAATLLKQTARQATLSAKDNRSDVDWSFEHEARPARFEFVAEATYFPTL